MLLFSVVFLLSSFSFSHWFRERSFSSFVSRCRNLIVVGLPICGFSVLPFHNLPFHSNIFAPRLIFVGPEKEKITQRTRGWKQKAWKWDKNPPSKAFFSFRTHQNAFKNKNVCNFCRFKNWIKEKAKNILFFFRVLDKLNRIWMSIATSARSFVFFFQWSAFDLLNWTLPFCCSLGFFVRFFVFGRSCFYFLCDRN